MKTVAIKDAAVMTPERMEVIRQAICESCHWLDLIRDKHAEEYLFPALAPVMFARMDVLNGIILNAVSDDLVSTARLEAELAVPGAG